MQLLGFCTLLAHPHAAEVAGEQVSLPHQNMLHTPWCLVWPYLGAEHHGIGPWGKPWPRTGQTQVMAQTHPECP